MERSRVLLKPFNSNVFYQNKIFTIENGHNIFAGIKECLSQKGIDIFTIDKKGKAAKYLYADVPYPWNIAGWLQILFTPKQKKVLFCFESPLVNPFNHLKFFYRNFGTIYTWNDELVSKLREVNKFNIPQVELRIPSHVIDFSKKKLIVCVNAKKNSISLFRMLSPYKTDLYKERFRYISFFEQHPEIQFDLYGKAWTKPAKFNVYEMIFGIKHLRVYKGEIPERGKIKVISHYKFCLCLENASAPGYITEKIFDCFIAGTVPLYKGAPNISNYIHEDCFVDLNKFQTDEALVSFLSNMTEKTYTKYLMAARAFILNKQTMERWGKSAFYELVTDTIQS
jgi:hypothetical protein